MMLKASLTSSLRVRWFRTQRAGRDASGSEVGGRLQVAVGQFGEVVASDAPRLPHISPRVKHHVFHRRAAVVGKHASRAYIVDVVEIRLGACGHHQSPVAKTDQPIPPQNAQPTPLRVEQVLVGSARASVRPLRPVSQGVVSEAPGRVVPRVHRGHSPLSPPLYPLLNEEGSLLWLPSWIRRGWGWSPGESSISSARHPAAR
jgi:hypothetical protein